ncbi:hypothetical protein MMC08_003786 [Hypocenomyce scalaris]|nr:hypothetical protein [Hypocenomyce scalaris]
MSTNGRIDEQIPGPELSKDGRAADELNLANGHSSSGKGFSKVRKTKEVYSFVHERHSSSDTIAVLVNNTVDPLNCTGSGKMRIGVDGKRSQGKKRERAYEERAECVTEDVDGYDKASPFFVAQIEVFHHLGDAGGEHGGRERATRRVSDRMKMGESVSPYVRRVMEEMITIFVMTALSDGTYLTLNGPTHGVASFGLASGPNLNAVLYDPRLPVNSRFSIIASTIVARFYHSEAILHARRARHGLGLRSPRRRAPGRTPRRTLLPALPALRPRAARLHHHQY